jgi:hypothetical protein
VPGASDADVLVELAPGTPGETFDWVRRCLRFFDLPIGVDTLVLRQDEVARRMTRSSLTCGASVYAWHERPATRDVDRLRLPHVCATIGQLRHPPGR